MGGEELIDGVMAPIEELVAMVPGAATPLGRVAIFGGAGAAYAMAVKPLVSFTEDGKARPWVLFDPHNEQAAAFPYWAWGVVPAVLFGVLL